MTTAYLSLFGYPSKSCSLDTAEMVSCVKSAKLNSSFFFVSDYFVHCYTFISTEESKNYFVERLITATIVLGYLVSTLESGYVDHRYQVETELE